MDIPKINVAIIDDEVNSIKNLAFYLGRFNSINLVKALKTFEEAVLYLSTTNEVDVIFLDINLGRNNGFELLEQLYNYSFKVVFVTAYEEYAVKAFRKNALDYILKPIDEQELQEVISKIENEFHFPKNELPEKGNTSKDRIDSCKRDFIAVRQSANIDFIPLSQIMYIEASGNYSQIVTDRQSPAEPKKIIARSVAISKKICLLTNSSGFINLLLLILILFPPYRSNTYNLT